MRKMAVVLDQAAAAQVPAAAVLVLVQAQAAAAKARAAAVQAAVVKAHQGRLDLLAAAALATQARLLVQALHRAVLQARVHPRAHLQDKGVVLMMQ
jgi:hypothetical protein